MKVLLFGGTGAMGIYLSKLLASQGKEVYVTSRHSRNDESNIHYIKGNAKEINFIKPILEEKWDAIVDFMKYSTDEFVERYSMFLCSATQYIFISSARVYANLETPISENSPRLLDASEDNTFLSTDEYSLSKAREEDILRTSTRRNYTIVRPYITYSDNRLQLGDLELQDWLPRALDGRSIVFSEDIAVHSTTMTFGNDVAKGIASLVGNPLAFGEIFHIVSSESKTWNEILNIYVDVLEKETGNRPKIKMIKQSMKLSKPSTKYQVLYDRCFDRIFANTKILSISQNLSFVPIEEGLRDCIRQYLEKYHNSNVSFWREAERDKITGEHMKLKNIGTFRNKLIYVACRYFGFASVIRRIR